MPSILIFWLSLFIYLFVSFSLFISLPLSTYRYICHCLCLTLSLFLSLFLSLSISLSPYLFLTLSLSLFLCLSMYCCLFNCLHDSIYLSTSLSVYLLLFLLLSLYLPLSIFYLISISLSLSVLFIPSRRKSQYPISSTKNTNFFRQKEKRTGLSPLSIYNIPLGLEASFGEWDSNSTWKKIFKKKYDLYIYFRIYYWPHCIHASPITWTWCPRGTWNSLCTGRLNSLDRLKNKNEQCDRKIVYLYNNLYNMVHWQTSYRDKPPNATNILREKRTKDNRTKGTSLK